MRLIPLFVAVAGAIILFMSAPIGADHGFRTTDDYVRQCSTFNPSETCKAGFRSAAVKFATVNRGRYCDPAGGIPNLAQSQMVWEREIPQLVGWLARHPQLGSQTYMDGLAIAMIAVYPCR
ncbi:MAG TPA: hypothetical protein VN154_13625 [Rhizomicrobium sp.]|nr:hypothetical protein [Rhizomicrobium sp.]